MKVTPNAPPVAPRSQDAAATGPRPDARATNTAKAPAHNPKPALDKAQVKTQEWGHPTLSYSVQKGDTLTQLGKDFATTVETLAESNFIENPNLIKVGQEVNLPTTFHVVESGDTYWGLGQKYNIDHKSLMALNQTDSSLLKVGQEIRVPAVTTTPELAQTRGEMKALVEEYAKADGKMFFGHENQVIDFGNAFSVQGPAESGGYYEFSDDFKNLKIHSHALENHPETIPLDDAGDLKKLLAADLISNGLHAQAWKANEEHGTPFNVDGPNFNDNGTVSFSLEVSDATIGYTYNARNGRLTVDDPAAGKPVHHDIGTRPGQVADGFAKAIGLKTPVYGF